MTDPLIERFFDGDPLAASRLMSRVERGGEGAETTLAALFPKMGRSYRVGVTGSTGSGKSTLVNGLVRAYRADGQTVGVVAEDPSSPFTGGAVLGDRIRMTNAIGDPGVFVRSVASRGNESGLSPVAIELADVMDAFGRDWILLETIGVGQLEYKIRFEAHTTVVVFTPEGGDDVQALKSGLMEIADVFAVNKSDRTGAGQFAAHLEAMVEMRFAGADWAPPVVPTVASEGTGIEALHDAIADHRRHLGTDGRFEKRRVEALESRIRHLAEGKIAAFFWQNPYIRNRFGGILEKVAGGELSPQEAAQELVDSLRIDTEEE
jgi:LAO/AO transport system kinase